ncbi:PaaX domain-containing protein, C- domain protein [Planomonospora sp. ID67723]|uniref:PaaX domain-containing protein, C- domain protein n=1 Tax=Planomonospora sp. ID67723 TaxID=2738134 RepID=UPI0018C40545|nr:PaaX domain-containing protein, C- domain protein [Planomonospora sp. ID67723]MBG0831222.1 PaaX domain-containing protein, C- domain protein [Planomonospora sp. ID67723]
MKNEDSPGLRPLTARSVVLSTLLGTHPPHLKARHLVRAGELFGISEGTVRVALSRMVAAGDLVQEGGDYRLSERLRERQARQDASRSPVTRDWDGSWEVAIVTAERRPAAERAAFRDAMAASRMAEIREGVWMRPDNLVRDSPGGDAPGPAAAGSELAGEVGPALVTGQCTFLRAVPEGDPAALAASLWDLPAWADRARALRDEFDAAIPVADRFVLAAAILRHLLTDPLLPPGLLPGDWPGAGLRHRYDLFETEFGALLRDRL